MKWNIFEDTLGDLKDLPEPDEVIPDLEYRSSHEVRNTS
jgi:hypothetical protein